MNDFYFHRPWWLLAIFPIFVFLWLFKRTKPDSQSNWNKHIDKHLIVHLMQSISPISKRSLLKIYTTSWVIAIIILSGPSWKKNPDIHFMTETPPLLLILDLSRSMLTRDIYPSRVDILRIKLRQLLNQLPPRPISLIVYSAIAHQVIPITEDIRLITNLLEYLQPDLMPAQASNSNSGLQMAAELIEKNKYPKAEILLVTDAIDNNSLNTVNHLNKSGVKISVYAIATEKGAYIPGKETGYLRVDGKQILSTLDKKSLQAIALAGEGLYQEVT